MDWAERAIMEAEFDPVDHDTSPISYLHQLELLHILRALAGGVIVPPAVVDELAEGLWDAIRVSVGLPSWAGRCVDAGPWRGIEEGGTD